MNYTALKADDYWVIIGKSGSWPDFHLINDGMWMYANGAVLKYENNSEVKTWFGGQASLIIATSKKISDELPLFDVPEWDDSINVEVAMQQYVLSNIETGAFVPTKLKKAWYAGFNTAKEKYQFTSEDIINAFRSGLHSAKELLLGKSAPTSQEYLQSLTKPKQYQVEIEIQGVCCSPMEGGIRHHGYCNECDGYTEQPKITEGKIKIITWKEL